MKRYRVLDLFAGGGGFSVGLLMAHKEGFGFDIVKALDIDADSCRTLEGHLGSDRVLHGDITEDEVKQRLITECADVDVIVGGPPCQTFSMAGPSRSGSPEMREALKNDSRNTLYKHFFRLVNAIRPKFFVFENVEGIISKEMEFNEESSAEKRAIELICDEIEDMGYSARVENMPTGRYQIMDAADYGTPQHRKRVIIIANRLGLPNPVPERTHGTALRPYRTLGETIRHLPVVMPMINSVRQESLKNMEIVLSEFDRSLRAFVDSVNMLAKTYSDRPEITGRQFRNLQEYVNRSYVEIRRRKHDRFRLLMDFIGGYNELAGRFNEDTSSCVFETLHRSRVHNFRDIVMFSLMNPGTNSAEFMRPESNQYNEFLSRLYPYDRSKHQDTYVKHAWDRPSKTILSHMERDGLRFIHPDQPRTFTPYEAALIQSFPPDYKFYGYRNSQYRQIGNAVPPLMARSIGNALLEALIRWESSGVAVAEMKPA